MSHGGAQEGKWRGNLRMEWVASTLYTTSEHGASSITTADAHNSVASSRLNWRLCRFNWTHPFPRKTKSGFCACAITFQTQSTNTLVEDGPNHSPCTSSFPFLFLFFVSPFFLAFFVSYISGSPAAVLETDSTVKDGFTSPVMTSYITQLHSSNPVISLISATQLFQTRSMFLGNSRTRVLQTEPVITGHWV
jgi:hypothetical protein